ncbi:MAG: hypothetical protein WAS27_02770 [Candidatus Saccharimonadales bacterium]
MVQEQQQATATDLSQSALNSAQAGVEDAKRALVRYQDYCLGSQAAAVTNECTRLAHALNDGSHCDTIQQAGITGSPDDKEVIVQQVHNDADAQLQQAYTCVRVYLNTVDYVGQLGVGGSRMIPLKATGDYNKVEIEWFSQADLKEVSTDNMDDNRVVLGQSDSLPTLAEWQRNRPALMRTQLIQFGESFMLDDFNKNDDGQSNMHTLFLSPSEVGRTELSFGDDVRLSATSGLLQRVACDRDFSTDSADRMYACKATIDLPRAVGQSDDKRTAYLRVNALYNDHTSFRVQLKYNDTVVKFGSVQPIVDSTGRANDLFRRIQSRVEIDNSTFPFPSSAVDISSSLCKTFLITDRTDDYVTGACTE